MKLSFTFPSWIEKAIVFSLQAEECYIVEDIQYWSTNADTLDDGNGIKRTDSVTECKEYCEVTFPGEANFFVYNEDDAQVGKKWKNSCRCKRDTGEERDVMGVTSGNLNCDHPVPEPPGEKIYISICVTIMEACHLKTYNLFSEVEESGRLEVWLR